MCEEIRIYAADLKAYNNGKLHGVWIDATDDTDSIQDQINEMLKNSPEGFAEEWAIHDYEGFGNHNLHEFTGINEAHEIALFIREHEDVALAALGYTNDLDEAKEMVEDRYHGCHDSEKDFAEQFYADCYEIPTHLEYYINYEAIARDLFINDFLSVEDGYQVHVFSHH